MTKPFAVGAMTLAALLSWSGAAIAASQGVVSDVQVVQTGATHYKVIVRSTAPLAFDPVAAAGEFDVRFYNMKLGQLSVPSPTVFGASLALSQEATGNILLRISGVDPSYRIAVVQGRNPNTVEINVGR